jgi:hypothetical protein
MERDIFDPSRVLRTAHRRAVCTGLTAALSIVLGAGCIDVNVIQANASARDGGLSVGVPCGSNGECISGFCADGYCCTEACRGPCEFCGPLSTSADYYSPPAGRCLPVPAGALDPHGVCPASTCHDSSWTPAATCDGAGACVMGKPTACGAGACNSKTNSCSCRTDVDCGSGIACVNGGCGLQALGQICATNSQCASKQCVEGVCCNSSCTSGCQTCTVTGALGTCLARPVGANPRDPADCPLDAPSTCGLDGTCDGSGACRNYLGNTCVSGTCNGDTAVGAYACDGTGRCLPGVASILCPPFTCDATGDAAGSCFLTCTSDAECDAQHTCNHGSCGAVGIAAHCNTGADCVSGFCADGVCCNIACQGGCVACNLPGRMGTCWPIDAGKPDPRGVCVDHGASTCGQDGTCDGLGGCADYAADTLCLEPSCSGNILDTAGSCDGFGTCRLGGTLDCDPFRCLDGACLPSCQTDNDCAAGHACVSGSCGPKSPGQSCASAGECASNNCVDGVCCDSVCAGSCRFCNLPGSPGHCAEVAADNPDPRGQCVDRGAASCDTNGKCDGSGSCARYAPGTACASETCVGGAYTPPSSCDAAGQCIAPDPRFCFPFVCNGTQCFSSCSHDSECAPPSICIDSSCGLKSNGASCSQASECTSGTCAQGICCDSACTGACQSCALSSSLGTCTNVPPHVVDPAGICTDQGASSCGADGRCDGNGACEKYLRGTVCSSQSCASGSDLFTAARTCDGAGTCLPPSSGSCAPYACGATVCKNACTSDGDCMAPATCDSSGACGTPTQARSSRR